MTKRQICWTSDFQNKCLHDLVLKARARMEGAVADSGNKQEREVRERWRRKLLKIKHPSTSVWPVETQNDVTVCGSKNDLEKSEGSRTILGGRLEEGIPSISPQNSRAGLRLHQCDGGSLANKVASGPHWQRASAAKLGKMPPLNGLEAADTN